MLSATNGTTTIQTTTVCACSHASTPPTSSPKATRISAAPGYWAVHQKCAPGSTRASCRPPHAEPAKSTPRASPSYFPASRFPRLLAPLVARSLPSREMPSARDQGTSTRATDGGSWRPNSRMICPGASWNMHGIVSLLQALALYSPH